ncbi:MFS multidrug transporter [Trichophyton tonsurans CBS 112818]|uniref:MFS multidrug transporter n=1 Tax=Trichophyton tonsurans (strain CBS 112818) TaxID=647933 RepID=F2RZS9_TRIT1|nr:MFS multidrug transporter [Trichophyton tonsurans CBS 112818]
MVRFRNLPIIRRLFARAEDGKPSFPTQQLFVLGLCRICEPIAFMSIFPYVYYMVGSFNVTTDDRKIAFYAGIVTSAFTLAEFSTGMLWGRVSDAIGRKPVLIMGLVGTAISMMVFGFASSLPMALMARALGGLLNGNIGVLQTTVAELVTNKEHQPRAYSIMPFVWCLGSIIGPAIGGALAKPCDSYPSLFPEDSIFKQYPFLLPNLVCVTVLLAGITIGILFLEETHAEKRHQRDRGRELGKYLVAKLFRGEDVARDMKNTSCAGDEDAKPFLYHDDPPPGYDCLEDPDTQESPAPKQPIVLPVETKKSKGFIKAFTPKVKYIILGYGLLAYHSVSFDQLMPVFLSTPASNVPVELPFKFLGGLSLTTKTVGFMLAVQGIYSMIAQLVLFPFVVRSFGTLNTYRFVISVWPVLYLAVPYLVLLPEALRLPAAYLALICKITLHVIAFPSNAILLANSAPSTTVLGSINGVAASTASLSRALGPTVTGFLHSRGLEHRLSILSWWACGLVCAIGAIESFWIEGDNAKPVQQKDVEKLAKMDVDDCEAGLQCEESKLSLDKTRPLSESSTPNSKA